MKIYRYSIIDYKKPQKNMPGSIVSERFICGISELRKACPVALNYTRNGHVWMGWDEKNRLEYFASEVGSI